MDLAKYPLCHKIFSKFCYPKIEMQKSTSASSNLNFGVAELAKSFGMYVKFEGQSHRKPRRLPLRSNPKF